MDNLLLLQGPFSSFDSRCNVHNDGIARLVITQVFNAIGFSWVCGLYFVFFFQSDHFYLVCYLSSFLWDSIVGQCSA